MRKKRKPGGRTPHLWAKAQRWGFIFGEIILIFLLANIYLLAKAQTPQESHVLANSNINLTTQNIRAKHFPFPIQWPIEGKISQNFSKGHPGLDIQATYGAKIHPLGPGVVKETGYRLGYGRIIVIQHKEGFSSMYAHLSKTQVEKDQLVELTTEIGNVGTSGWTTGPHLHLEIYENGKVVDPKNILP